MKIFKHLSSLFSKKKIQPIIEKVKPRLPKCNHKIVESIRGRGQIFVCQNPRCKKTITKGKQTPDKAFGKSKGAPYTFWSRPKTNREEVYIPNI